MIKDMKEGYLKIKYMLIPASPDEFRTFCKKMGWSHTGGIRRAWSDDHNTYIKDCNILYQGIEGKYHLGYLKDLKSFHQDRNNYDLLKDFLGEEIEETQLET